MFSLLPQFEDDRDRLTRELKRKLETLRDSPHVVSSQVLIGDGTTSHDALLFAYLPTQDDLVALRASAAHREIIEWYVRFFDDSMRAQVDGEIEHGPHIA